MTAERTADPYLPVGLPAPVPSPDGLDAEFWAGTRQGEIRFQRCSGCGTRRAPEWICHRCHSFDATWSPVAPRGTIYAWERIWHPAMPALAEACPYLAVVVEIADAEGLRLVGNLLGDPMQEVRIGARVDAVFEDHDEYTLVQWRVAG
jgi:uncharacterized OB-fold protein